MGESALNVVTHPTAIGAAKALEERLGQPWVPLMSQAVFEEFPALYSQICSSLQIPQMDTARIAEQTDSVLQDAAKRLGGRPVMIDDGASTDPVALTLCLLRHGFRVKRIFADGIPPLAKASYETLCLQYPQVEIVQGDLPEMARAYREGRFLERGCVAIGETAAYLSHTRYFVPQIGFGGALGFHSLTELAENMADSVEHPRDPVEILEGDVYKRQRRGRQILRHLDRPIFSETRQERNFYGQHHLCLLYTSRCV